MAKNSKIHGIIWDIGNVLLNLNFPKAHNFFIKTAGIDAQSYYNIKMLQKSQVQEFEMGKISEHDFFKRFCIELNITISFEVFHRIWNDIFTPNQKNISFLRLGLKKGLRSIALSNTNRIHLPFIVANYSFFQELDGIVASCELGSLKPNPDIYQYAISKYSLDPRRTIFIDDREENIEAAKELDFETYLYKRDDEEFAIFLRKCIPGLF